MRIPFVDSRMLRLRTMPGLCKWLLFIFCVLTHFGFAEQVPKEECESRFSTCTSDEKYQSRKSVCGTDNQTYPSKCHLQMTHCQGVPVTIKHRGRCKDDQPCWMDLNIRHNPQTSFAPKCNEDGSYAPVQCHEETGYCWCVTHSGKPIPKTSVRYKRPNCHKRGRRGKSSLHRRSPSQAHRQRKGKKKSKNCERNERAQFNNNLIAKFKIEYSQQTNGMSTNEDPSDTQQVDFEHSVLNWKFSMLDIDSNDYLDISEYRDLRQMVRKIIKPRKCAKVFTRLCDKDHDERISRDEWSICLGLDFSLLQGSLTPAAGLPLEFDEDSSSRKDELEVSDCLQERKLVLDEQFRSDFGGNLYIPECMPDGRYQKKQCYKSTGYCWCVQETDGKPIPGTSTKNQDPKCESIQMSPKHVPGCPESKRQVFLKELADIMEEKMDTANRSGILERNKPVKETWQTYGEMIATWNFNVLDKNQNKVLEKKEWKNFRSLFSSSRHLRRCGKRFPRYCDANFDRKISLTEWLSCLNPENSNTNMNATPPPASRRRGKNPLMTYLRGDS